MMFAEAAPSDHSQWLTNLQFFFSVILSVGAIWALVSNRPQKREVKFEEEFARKEDLAAMQAEVLRLRVDLGDMEKSNRESIAQVDEKNENRIKLVHDRVNEILAAVSRVEGKIEQFSGRK